MAAFEVTLKTLRLSVQFFCTLKIQGVQHYEMCKILPIDFKMVGVTVGVIAIYINYANSPRYGTDLPLSCTDGSPNLPDKTDF